MECKLCGAPVPEFNLVLWCDACIDECLKLHREGKITVQEFVKMKKSQ